MNNFIESLESKKLSKHFNNLSDYEKGKNEGLNAAIEIFKNLHPENEIVKPILTKLEYAAIQIASGISNYVKLDIDEVGARFIGVDMVSKMSVEIAKSLLTEIQNTDI